jgi:hypothetical protein
LRGISGLEEPIGAERSEGSDHFLVGLLIRHSIRRTRGLPPAPVEAEDQRQDCATDCAPYGGLSLISRPERPSSAR